MADQRRNKRVIISALMVINVLLIPCLVKSSDPLKDLITLRGALNITGAILVDPHSLLAASQDFGNVTVSAPMAVFCPSSPDDVGKLLGFVHRQGGGIFGASVPVAARGQGHSLRGQASAGRGVVVNTTCLPGGVVLSGDGKFADVAAGTMWVDVLTKTLEKGLSPVSWTDYLYLSVGGTLSNAGISGQTFRHGPQISNVLELDVITGKGQILTCSANQNPELFYGVLGGLGQFGIISRARIPLEPAPNRVKYMRFLYSDFAAFTRDQERLISDDASIKVDYLEGQLSLANALVDTSFYPPSDQPRVLSLVKQHSIIYALEIALYYDDVTLPTVSRVIDELSKTLGFVPSFAFVKDVSYMEFLNRVRPDEEELRSLGLWEVPHPWLNMFVPRSRITDFHDGVFKNILSNHNGSSGPLLFYPTNRNKWDDRMSAVVPEEEVFYVVGLLLSARPDNLPEYENLNQQITEFCNKAGINYKGYLTHYTRKEEWVNHFGQKWNTFQLRKTMFDPMRMLSPGQDIFN